MDRVNSRWMGIPWNSFPETLLNNSNRLQGEYICINRVSKALENCEQWLAVFNKHNLAFSLGTCITESLEYSPLLDSRALKGLDLIAIWVCISVKREKIIMLSFAQDANASWSQHISTTWTESSQRFQRSISFHLLVFPVLWRTCNPFLYCPLSSIWTMQIIFFQWAQAPRISHRKNVFLLFPATCFSYSQGQFWYQYLFPCKKNKCMHKGTFSIKARATEI